ncbi:hypothetical protein AMJ87_03645 [candidate division WOR_3 bacterium SM23_60]|uniref:Uncharacterized protein n=1 Tax=candidate division WOR_3 bacterium SM23_60 TaxID=1703780 RepID=A0A0S8GIZ3_UNCW3|nr:MAG: hypothetical protein AMJ87_03645 [candidate division WOR_3 bacterium SM23_60]
MRKTDTLVHLENLCKTLSINVKYDRFFGRGGYCRLKDKSFFIINERLSNETKEQIFITELKTFDLADASLPSKLRELFEQ